MRILKRLALHCTGIRGASMTSNSPGNIGKAIFYSFHIYNLLFDYLCTNIRSKMRPERYNKKRVKKACFGV